jgi:hypothetical protein
MDRDDRPTFALRHFDGQSIHSIALPRLAGELFELEEEIAMVASAIRDGKPPAASGIDGTWAVALCQAAQTSIDRDLPVDVGDVWPGRGQA